jgi:hypothetical protein
VRGLILGLAASSDHPPGRPGPGASAVPATRGLPKLTGVPESSFGRVVARLRGLRVGDKAVVSDAKAFGSRAGSTFRGRGPTAASDLDVTVDIDPRLLGGRNGPWINRVLREIEADFLKEAARRRSARSEWDLAAG